MEKLRIVLLSGPFKVGKSTLTAELVTRFFFQKVSSSAYLLSLVPDITTQGHAETRLRLQEKGDQLDAATDYSWVIDPVTTSAIAGSPDSLDWLVDAVRKERQVEHFRERYGSSVVHVHLVAPEATLRARSALTADEYSRAASHPNEISSRSLLKCADRVFDTSLIAAEEIAANIAEEAR